MEFLVSWQDRQKVYHNGAFVANNIKELREQTEGLGKITSIQLLNTATCKSNNLYKAVIDYIDCIDHTEERIQSDFNRVMAMMPETPDVSDKITEILKNEGGF